MRQTIPHLVLAISTSIPAGLFLLTMLIGTWQLCWAWILLGAVLLDTCCLCLKEVIRQARPIDPAPAFVLESEGLYGMPSEHAAFVMYLFVHLGMRLSRSDWDRLAKSIACLALATWGAALVTTRYVYGAHSLPQLLVGGSIGFIAGRCWSSLEAELHRPLQQWQNFVDSSRICVQSLYGFEDHED